MDDNASATRKYAEKEAFVTGHDGTTPIEIFLLCLAVPIGLRLHPKILSCVPDSCTTNKSRYWIEIAIEFAVLIFPNLLLQTSYITGPSASVLAMTILSSISSLQQRTANISHNQSKNNNKTNIMMNNSLRRPTFLTVHRAAVYIQTAIAILAVDFPIFPRRYCKTEQNGYGWMDLGAASFVIIAGWSSSSSDSSSVTAPFVDSIKKAAIKCTPLLLLGIIRLITIKGVEYQEHVSEYGVHWNFFFTLCCLEGGMVLWKYVKCLPFFTKMSYYYCDGALACILLIPYQLYLTFGGGQDFIENGPRHCSNKDFMKFSSMSLSLCRAFVANREGILGTIGYFSLRLLSESMASYCVWTNAEPNDLSNSSRQRPSVTTSAHNYNIRNRRLFIVSVAFWIAHIFVTIGLDVPTSRRSTNVSFILWSLAQNASVLFLIHIAMTSKSGQSLPAPRLFDSINRFGLPVFFVSNILTGLVNFLVDTMHSSNEKAMLVLSMYLIAVCGLALALEESFPTKEKRR